MKADYRKYTLDFKRPGGTSRGVLHQKETYFLRLEADDKVGFGECAVFRGLSYDDRPDYEEKLQWLCANIEADHKLLRNSLKCFPSIMFGWEQALLSLRSRNPFELFSSPFNAGRITWGSGQTVKQSMQSVHWSRLAAETRRKEKNPSRL